MGKLIRPGIATNVAGPVDMFPRGLSEFGIVLGEGWTQEGIRAFVWELPSVAAFPSLQISGLEAGEAYDVAMNVTEHTGTTPQARVRLGFNVTNALTIAGVGVYTLQKYIAGADNDRFDVIIDDNTRNTRLVIKSLYIRKVS